MNLRRSKSEEVEERRKKEDLKICDGKAARKEGDESRAVWGESDGSIFYGASGSFHAAPKIIDASLDALRV